MICFFNNIYNYILFISLAAYIIIWTNLPILGRLTSKKNINFRQASCQRRFPSLDAMGTYGNAETKTLWAAETGTAAGQCYCVFVEAQPIYAPCLTFLPTFGWFLGCVYIYIILYYIYLYTCWNIFHRAYGKGSSKLWRQIPHRVSEASSHVKPRHGPVAATVAFFFMTHALRHSPCANGLHA